MSAEDPLSNWEAVEVVLQSMTASDSDATAQTNACTAIAYLARSPSNVLYMREKKMADLVTKTIQKFQGPEHVELRVAAYTALGFLASGEDAGETAVDLVLKALEPEPEPTVEEAPEAPEEESEEVVRPAKKKKKKAAVKKKKRSSRRQDDDDDDDEDDEEEEEEDDEEAKEEARLEAEAKREAAEKKLVETKLRAKEAACYALMRLAGSPASRQLIKDRRGIDLVMELLSPPNSSAKDKDEEDLDASEVVDSAPTEASPVLLTAGLRALTAMATDSKENAVRMRSLGAVAFASRALARAADEIRGQDKDDDEDGGGGSVDGGAESSLTPQQEAVVTAECDFLATMCRADFANQREMRERGALDAVLAALQAGAQSNSSSVVEAASRAVSTFAGCPHNHAMLKMKGALRVVEASQRRADALTVEAERQVRDAAATMAVEYQAVPVPAK